MKELVVRESNIESRNLESQESYDHTHTPKPFVNSVFEEVTP